MKLKTIESPHQIFCHKQNSRISSSFCKKNENNGIAPGFCMSRVHWGTHCGWTSWAWNQKMPGEVWKWWWWTRWRYIMFSNFITKVSLIWTFNQTESFDNVNLKSPRRGTSRNIAVFPLSHLLYCFVGVFFFRITFSLNLVTTFFSITTFFNHIQ